MKAIERLSTPAICAGALIGVLLWGAATYGQSPASGPRRYTVADVIIQGNRIVPTQGIMARLRTRPGTEYIQEVVNEDVRRLYESRQFGNVRVDQRYTADGRVIVYFLVVEFPSEIQEVVYLGAKHLKDDDLTNLSGIRKGQPLNPLANQMACQAIVRRLNDDGRPLASCEVIEGHKDGDKRVVFQITEGPIVKVSSIKFVGNSFVSGGRLATQINSSKTFLGFGGKYNPMLAELDVAKLEEYYKAHGFQDVRVSKELQYTADSSHLTLVFHINEGVRYKVGKVTVEGVKEFPREQIEAVPKTRIGEFYNEYRADADVSGIKDYYGWAGRPTLVQKKLFYPEPGVVAVHYEVMERPPSRVGQVFVTGNEVTKQNVILRQLPLYPGQVLTYPDLRQAEKNLARLNIFESNPETGVRPTVSVIDPDNDSEFKDVLVSVQETRTGSLLFGVGVNSDAGLTGSIVLNERNFDIMRPPTSFEDLLSGHAWRGAGQEMRIEAVPGTQLQRYSATFREPFLFDSPYSLTTGAYYYTRAFNEYDEKRLGTRVTLGRKLNQYWSVSGGLRLENVGISGVSPFAPPTLQDAVGDNLLVGLRAGVTRDTRDSFMRPTEGNLLDLSFEQVVGEYNFPVVSLEGNQYFTVWQRPDGSGRHVLAYRGQVAYAGPQTPVFERFYAGGFRSLRGFQFRGVGPTEAGFKVGGDFMLLNSVEYQVPVRANDQMFLVAFVDSGTVESDVEIKNYRVSAGFGVRFIVPMLGPVPIALDFGFPIVKAEADEKQLFSFWLGFFH